MKVTTSWILILLYITLATGAVAGLYVMYVVTNEALSLRNAAQEELRRASGEDSYTRSLMAIARDTREKRETLASLFFNENLLDAIDAVESIGADAGVRTTIRSVGTPTQTAGSALAVVPLTVEVTGSFIEVFHAISLFEVAPHAMMISQMHIIQLENGDDWSANLQIAVGQVAERKDVVKGNVK